MSRRLLLPTLGAVAAALLLALPAAPRTVRGQTIPLRPTPTLQGGSVSVLPQPTPPTAPALPPARAAPPRPAASVIPAPAPSPTAPPAPTALPAPPATAPPSGLEPFRVEHVALAAAAAPAPPPSWRVAESAFRVTGVVPAGQAGNISLTFSSRDLAAAGGVVANLAVFALDSGGAWTRVASQSLDPAAGRITFRPPGAGVFVVLAAGSFPEGDYLVAGGRFFRANGSDAPGGFSVLDGAGGARSAFWTVYAAAGGEAVLGRPVSRRFISGEQLVQHFERGIVFSDPHTNATARPGAPTSSVPAGAREPEPPPLPAS